jgi:16S rRNA (guanine966-N2)-methyltransferase
LVRGAIFDALESLGVDRARVLDLYAGSGALGIEALSRGGGWCDFVERDAGSAEVIRENLMLTGFQERGRVHRLDVKRVSQRLEGPYSLLFADPPYDDVDAPAVLERIARLPLIGPDTTLVLEHSSRKQPPQEMGSLRPMWSRRYGDTQVSIYGG